MFDSNYVALKEFIVDKLGIGNIESDVRGVEGPYELPPSRGWPCQ